MFSRQTPTLDNALWQGGLSAAQAHVISNALGQCRQTLEHRGPIQVDYSSPDMKLIMPESAQIQFPEIQLQPPEALPPRSNVPNYPDIPPEELPPYNPDPLPPPQGPEYPGSGNNPGQGGSIGIIGPNCCAPDWLVRLMEDAFKEWEEYKEWVDKEFSETRLESGNFIDVDYNSLSVDLITSDEGEGNICTFDTDTIKGIPKDEFVESISDELDDYVEDYLKDDNSGTSTTVVTGIQINNGKLEITTRTVRVLTAGTPGTDSSINLTEC